MSTIHVDPDVAVDSLLRCVRRLTGRWAGPARDVGAG